VGGDAQVKAMRQVAGRMRLELASFRELAAFAQFGSDLDRATRDQLERGQRLTELLKQPQYEPVPLDEQIIGIYAVTNGLADDVPLDKIRDFEAGLVQFMRSVHPEIGQAIMGQKVLTDEINELLRSAIQEYKQTAGF
jgi:F-type H+-transporting ATPase subunit alpha